MKNILLNCLLMRWNPSAFSKRLIAEVAGPLCEILHLSTSCQLINFKRHLATTTEKLNNTRGIRINRRGRCDLHPIHTHDARCVFTQCGFTGNSVSSGVKCWYSSTFEELQEQGLALCEVHIVLINFNCILIGQ